MKTVLLNGIWKISGSDEYGNPLEFDGMVPGTVHTDMIKLGMIKDPMVSTNSEECQWIENVSWTYEKSFVYDPRGGECILNFDMLDVYCDVFLNEKKLGFCDNMFINHFFDVSDIIRKGENKIKVKFYPPAPIVSHLPKRNCAFTSERLYTRRIQCTYLWDWVDRFVTMGICGDVTLKIPAETEIENVFVRTTNIDSNGAQILVSAKFSKVGISTFASIELLDPDGRLIFSDRRLVVEKNMTLSIDIENPRLWNPSGYGEQNLYNVVFVVRNSSDEIVSEKNFRYGLRDVKIIQLPDKEGSENYSRCLEIQKSPLLFPDKDKNTSFSGFTIIVNGNPIMCKGANFVPSEPFVSSETYEKITQILILAKEAGMNFVRVWGGGVFEKDHFYSECDRLGLMVSQDFLMACGTYPQEDEDFCRQLAKEAEFATVKLRNHPCLIWWSGDNENAIMADDSQENYNGRKITREIIEPIVRKNDPDRYYFPSSPYGGTPYASATVGTAHNTWLLGDIFGAMIHSNLEDYQKVLAGNLTRFSAEEPVFGAVSESSMLRFMTKEEFEDEEEKVWRFHTKNNPSLKEFEIYDCLRAGAEKLFGKFKDNYDMLYKMQYLQYDWIRLTLELNRRSKWFSSGILYWMLNDCWPALGWSVIDYYTKPKAAWYAFKRSAKGVISSFEREEQLLKIYVCNDTLFDESVNLKVYEIEEGRTKSLFEGPFESKANTSAVAAQFKADVCCPEKVYVCDLESRNFSDRAIWFSKRPVDICGGGGRVEIIKDGGEFIILRSTGFVHCVILDLPDGVFGENYFCMLEGEEKTVRLRNRKQGERIKISTL